MTKILLIHGINNQDNTKEKIEREWSDAIKQGMRAAQSNEPNDVQFNAAFYGNLLHRETENWKDIEEDTTSMSANFSQEEYVFEVAALYEEYKKVYKCTDDQVIKALLGEDNPNYARMAKGVHKRWLKAIAVALENISPLRGRIIAQLFLRQAAAYLHKPGLKKQIDDIVYEDLFRKLDPNDNVIVVSHSLGTIVAYEL